MNDYFDYVANKFKSKESKAPEKEPPSDVKVIDPPEELNEPNKEGEIQVEELDASPSIIEKIRNSWK